MNEKGVFTGILEDLLHERELQHTDERLYEPLPPGDFFLSEYHCGMPRDMITPFWLDTCVEFIEGGFSELIITGSLGCLNENTRVATSEGLLSLKEIAKLFVSKDIYVLSESGKRKVVQVHDNGLHDTLKITTRRGSVIEGTYNHTFRVASAEGLLWKRLDELKVGDWLVKTRNKHCFGTVSEDPAAAYTLGYLIGDGNIGKYPSGVRGTMMVSYADTSVEDTLKEGLTYLFGGWHYARLEPNNKQHMVQHKLSISISNAEAMKPLLDGGFGIHAVNKNVPDYVFTWDRDSICNVLAGLWDSDGTIDLRKNWLSFTSISEKLVGSIQELLSMLGISSYIGWYKNAYDGFFVLSVDTRRSKELFKDLIHLRVGYKKEKLSKVSTEFNKNTRAKMPFGVEALQYAETKKHLVVGRKGRRYAGYRNGNKNVAYEVVQKINEIDPDFIDKSEYLRYAIDNDCYFDQVKGIEKTECYTRDLGVEDDHSYVVNGFVSHNSFKSSNANMITLYKFYELFSYKNMHAYLDLPEVQDIYNIYFSVNLTQAFRTGYKQLREMLDQSRWFQANFPRNKHLNSLIEFPNRPRFSMYSGSGHQHAMGATVFSFILDEGDFFKKSGGSAGFDDNHDYVTNMYGEMVDRRVSRFKSGGKDKSYSILISSASFQSSFVAKRIVEAEKDPQSMVVKAIRYKIIPEKYSEEKFVVFLGTEMVEPELVESTKAFNSVLSKINVLHRVPEAENQIENYNNLPAELKEYFETPPMDLYQRYRKNLPKSLMNFSGAAVAGMGKLFQSRKLLFGAYTEELAHPFTKDGIELSTGDKAQLKDYFQVHMIKDIHKPHAIHVDTSLTTDSTGISMVRFDGEDAVEGNIRRYYSQVFSLEILPPPPPFQIKLSKITDFIFYLKDELKVNIVAVSYDQFQSSSSLQLLKDKGVNAFKKSVDRTDNMYLAWMGLLHDECIRHYKHPVMEAEAFAAIHYRAKKKVDHPSQGSVNINVLQSFVGALDSLLSIDPNEFGAVVNYPILARKAGKVTQKDVDFIFNKGVRGISGALPSAKKGMRGRKDFMSMIKNTK